MDLGGKGFDRHAQSKLIAQMIAAQGRAGRFRKGKRSSAPQEAAGGRDQRR
jgi:hypothetical protein